MRFDFWKVKTDFERYCVDITELTEDWDGGTWRTGRQSSGVGKLFIDRTEDAAQMNLRKELNIAENVELHEGKGRGYVIVDKHELTERFFWLDNFL